MEFVRDALKCNMKFLDADVKRPLVSVSAIVDEGHIVVFGPQESYIENMGTGQRIPLSRSQGVFVMRLDARAGTRSTKTVKFDELNTNSVSWWPARTNMRKTFVNALRTTHNFKQERNECATRIEEVDDAAREEQEEQRKQEEEPSSAKQRPRASEILDKRVNKKEFNTKLRIFRFAVGADKASGEEDERKTTEEERQVPEIHLDYMFMGDKKEGHNIGFLAFKRTSDKSCAHHCGLEEIDGRMDMPKADGVAP